MKTIAIYNPYLSTRGGGEKLCLSLAETLSHKKDTHVTMLTYDNVDLDALGNYFKLDLSKVDVTVMHLDTWFMRLVRLSKLPIGLKNFFYDQRNISHMRKYKFDIFVNHCYHSNLPNVGKYGLYMCMFPQKLASAARQRRNPIKVFYHATLRELYKTFIHHGHKESVATYQQILSISEFTASYIKEYWHTTSELIYPICEDMYDQRLNEKRKIILNTGRFFERVTGNHHKRQDVLLKAFSDMKDLHKAGWELHFVGSVAEDAGALKYILGMLKMAEGLPVFFHFNADFSDSKRLFNEASVYWHATGYGTDEKKYPEMQEHFGITTVEAMSAGCVPIVYASGGQPDIIAKSEAGYTWKTLEELKKLTERFVETSHAEKVKMEAAIRSTSIVYDKVHFKDRVDAVFEDLL